MNILTENTITSFLTKMVELIVPQHSAGKITRLKQKTHTKMILLQHELEMVYLLFYIQFANFWKNIELFISIIHIDILT